MPELPGVETIRRGLSRLIVGKTVKFAKNYDSAKSFPNALRDVKLFQDPYQFFGLMASQVYARGWFL